TAPTTAGISFAPSQSSRRRRASTRARTPRTSRIPAERRLVRRTRREYTVASSTGGPAMNLFKAMAVANPEAASQAIPVSDVDPAFRREPGGGEAVARPVGHERMRATMVRYMKGMEALGERTLPLLAHALDMPADHFAPFFRDEAHITARFLHYPPQETDDDEQFGQGPHTDNSFITFLA